MRLAVVSSLIAAYLVLGLWVNLVYQSSMVYTHLAYIPIALAGLWWGRRGLYVPVALSAVLFAFYPLGLAVGPFWHDAIRAFFFFIAGFCIGILSEGIKKGQRQLRVSEKKYHMLLNDSLSGIIAIQGDFVVFANSRFGQMVGLDPAHIIGKFFWGFIHADDQIKMKEYLDRNLGEIAMELLEVQLQTGKEETLWVGASLSRTLFEGKPATLISFFDIREKKDAESKKRELAELTRQQEEQLVHSSRLAELGEMAAGIAHELNQPLTGIRSFTDNTTYMIKKGIGGKDDIIENLNLISGQVERASKIIHQMRELTRKSEKNFVLLQINDIIKESVEFLYPQLKLAGVTTTVELDESLPLVLGDRIRLVQVLLNILTNARQAMEETEIRKLNIKSRCQILDYRRVIEVEISDTGRGFSQTDAEKIFLPFFTTKKSGHGTGLGLSISHSIIKEHQGKITAVSSPDEGAKFILWLPAMEREEENKN